ncbi:dicarboxylate/amino acid:cation symporter [Novosphingobium resinovorum]
MPGISEFLASLLPDNVISAAAASAMLPVIVFVGLFALASTRLADEPRRALAVLFEALAGAMMVVIGWVLMLAPIGVFALGLTLGVRSGGAALGALAHYILLVVAVGTVVMIAGYVIAVIGGKRSLPAFAAAMLPAQVVAISTQSSIATVPAMLASSRKLGVSSTTAEFVLPLAVTLFRATGPAMNMAVAVYAAKLAGLELTTGALAAGAFVAFATTFGAVSLPGTISFVSSIGPIAAAMGVPLWPLGVLVAVEVLPDLMRTIGNVTMDVAVAAAVDAGIDEQPATAETIH